MPIAYERVNLGGPRAVYANARATGPSNPEERMEVSMIMRHNNEAMLKEMAEKIAAGDRSVSTLSRDEFTRMFGATNADRAQVKQFASEHGLLVLSENVARATIHLSGTVAQFEQAFGVHLQQFAYAHGTYRGTLGSPSVPRNLQGVLHAVLGLDTRPVAQTRHLVNHAVQAPTKAKVSARAKAAGQEPYFSPDEFAALYNFPDSDGTGQCVAILELGGGYYPSDNQSYFAELGLQVPEIVAVSVEHAQNAPGGIDDGADGEVALDIQVIGALAQGAKQAVYFAPNTDEGFLNAVNSAVYDSINRPSVISISWGAPESMWTNDAMQAMNTAFQTATVLGITVFAAAGDNGSSDGMSDNRAHADFPSSSPFVAACGGTSTVASGTEVASESVWNNMSTIGGATGGAISSVFALPSYQKGLTVTLTGGKTEPLSMRGTPDITGNADPNTGYLVMVGGAMTVIGGTSAVAPLMAALIARINSALKKKSGFIHPAIYANAAQFTPVTEGNNGAFQAAAGWSAATGVGRPDGVKLQALLA
jgi:kumamolisin